MTLHPQFITDIHGNRISVVLPIAEYERIMERLEDAVDLAEAREAIERLRQGAETTVPWSAVKAEHGL